MNFKSYKCCAVPQCTSTSIKTPNKLFVHVPNKKLIRGKWLKLARRNPNDVVTNSPLYFCEDHFDMPNDMENYMQYHVMKSVSQVRMKPGCMPHKFTCQSDRKSRTSDTTERPYIAKKRRMMILEECKKEFEEKCIVTKQSSVEEITSISSISSVQQNVDELPQLAPRVLDKSVQVNIYKKYRSKANQTKVNLRLKYRNLQNALNQALSWSDYKKANTIKYLISCTPNGLINYISNGYGGRITDTCIVETSDFSKCLQPNMWVMADRGFKHVEVYLRRMGVKLVRPPSVVSGCKLSKAEAKETKQIASLRIHVERVIRRIREFNMLKPHACLNLSLVKVLDDVITIACGLINLQDSLIK
ncbi:unnamed protein product [Colias eurytheme]|nr:unnamed protein product [Colias eurytheme]